MALLLKPLRCPSCHQPMDKRLLRQSGQLKAFLARKAFACPHCDARLRYPESADTLVSSGIFVAVILAPLFHLWSINFLSAQQLFALGIALIITGVITQKLQYLGPADNGQ